jgi:D-alanine transaminase/branched-chain amino acid aminotransferase
MIYPYLFINGDILQQDKALIPIYDLALLRGMGIFDFFRVLDGVAVFAEDHIERLQNSMQQMGLNVDYSATDWADKFKELIQVNNADRAGFRVVVTGGFSDDGYSIPERKNVYMILHELPPNDPVQFDKGVSLITSDYRRDIPTAKTTIYVRSMQMQPRLKKEGAFEVLYHWNGQITECSRCNIFFIDQEGKLITPDAGMLHGITRKQIIAIAHKHDIPVVERTVTLSEMPAMAGSFLTASTKGVLPVVKIDNQVIGDGLVHPLCVKLQQLFQERIDQYIASARLAQMVL